MLTVSLHSAVPPSGGLFNAEDGNKDACGVGFVGELSGIGNRRTVTDALEMLRRMEHRGACGCESDTGARPDDPFALQGPPCMPLTHLGCPPRDPCFAQSIWGYSMATVAFSSSNALCSTLAIVGYPLSSAMQPISVLVRPLMPMPCVPRQATAPASWWPFRTTSSPAWPACNCRRPNSMPLVR